MDHREVGRYWDGNAEAWTHLARAGYDECRDHVNTPAFFAMLPEVRGLRGVDIGCGEGYNTRLVAQRGAEVTALDISRTFIGHASAAERAEPLGIHYLMASAVELPFADASFDFATAFMCFMDIGETDRVIGEAYRVIRPGGFLQFSITHPCYDTPYRRKLRDERGQHYAYAIGEYFHNLDGESFEWLFSAAPPQERARWRPFQTPRFTRTLSQWLNLLADTGFVIEQLCEPYPDEAVLLERPDLADMLVIAFFLQVRCRKPR
jgi:ubiquinone/menaquinone biosynthesis C-methylase UbiE